MSDQKITRILFDENTALHFFSGDEFRGDDSETIQKAADSMLANENDLDEISEERQNEHMLTAAGLPKDLLYREIPYVCNEELCSYIKNRLAHTYRLGLVTLDKPSAKLALGEQYTGMFNDILLMEEMPDNPRYFFEDALLISSDTSGLSDVAAACRIYKYSTTNELARYLASPPPFVAPIQEGSNVRKSVGKGAASTVPMLRNTPKGLQYSIDFVIVALIAVGVAYLFPNELDAFLKQIKQVLS